MLDLVAWTVLLVWLRTTSWTLTQVSLEFSKAVGLAHGSGAACLQLVEA